METRSVVVLKQYTAPEVEPDVSAAASVAAQSKEEAVTRSPVSTYRLQVTEEFDLFEVARRLPYLHELGADWVYLSPLLQAEAGSTHGYDVVAHDRIDPARGGEKGLAAVSAEARRLGMGVLVDIVPNHVGVATPRDNALVVGPAPARARVRARGRLRRRLGGRRRPDPDPRGRRRRLGPATGRIDHLAVADGELRYHDHRFPLAPGRPTTARTRTPSTIASTTSSCTGRSPTTASTTGASSP